MLLFIFLFLLNISVAKFLNFLIGCWFLVCLVENLIWVFLGFLYYAAVLCGGGVAWYVFAVFSCKKRKRKVGTSQVALNFQGIFRMMNRQGEQGRQTCLSLEMPCKTALITSLCMFTKLRNWRAPRPPMKLKLRNFRACE